MSQLGAGSSTERTAADRGQRTNPLAVWALVLAVLTLGGVGSLLGIVLGARARGQVQREGGRGAGLATAAIVVGVVTLVASLLYWAALAGGDGGGGGGGGTY